MSTNESFFVKKKPWSIIKDKVLIAYLEPYLAKVSSMGVPIRIADTFAGKGMFEDGNPGSPVIISEAIRRQLSRYGNRCDDIKGVFIEKKYPNELKETLSEHSSYSKVLDGEYEERMNYFLDNYLAMGMHFLFYVDPYGIKSLRFSHFERLKEKRPLTVEVLLNMNAFGFMREGCRLMGLESDIDETPEFYYQDIDNLDRMDEIAGGSYWRSIVEDFYSKTISMKEAEERFVHQYREQMKAVFQYVIDIPIKEHLNHIPKYRIIYCTDHEDGLLLMADNMHKRWDEFKQQDRDGTIPLFEIDFPDPCSTDYALNIESEIMKQLSSQELPLKELLVRLIASNGIIYSTNHYKKTLKDLEASGGIIVRRDPERTDKGKKRSGWDHMAKEYKIYLSRKNEWQASLL